MNVHSLIARHLLFWVIGVVCLVHLVPLNSSRAEESLIEPAAEIIVMVDQDMKENFIEVAKIFAHDHNLSFDLHYLPFRTKPFTQMIMANAGIYIVISNARRDNEFVADFGFSSPAISLGDLPADFVLLVRHKLGDGAIKLNPQSRKSR